MSELTPMTEVTDHEITIKELRYCYRLWQGGMRPAIALHGWLDNAASFDRLAPALSDSTVLALDLAGHGLSGHRHPQASYNIWDDLLDILDIADAMGWQHFDLIGHSRGAIISMLLSAVQPDRIARLVLLDGIWPMPVAAEQTAQQLASYIADHRKPQRPAVVYRDEASALDSWSKSSRMSETAARYIVARGLKKVDGGYSWRYDPRLRHASAFKLGEDHINALMSAIQAPTLACLAARGYGAVESLVQRLDLDFSWVEKHMFDSTHHLHLEDGFEALALVITKFLNSKHP